MEEQRKKQYINLPNLKIIDIFPTRTITWVEKATSLETALQVMKDLKVLSVPLVDLDSNSVIGIVDVLDIATFIVASYPSVDQIQFENTASLHFRGQTIVQEVNVGQVMAFSKYIKYSNLPFFPVFLFTPLEDLIASFSRGIHRIPVVDTNNKILNFISQSDVIRYFAENMYLLDNGNSTLEGLGIICRTVHYVREDAPVVLALSLIAVKRVSAVPVLDMSGKLVGTFSASELRGIGGADYPNLLRPIRQFLQVYNFKSLFPITCTPADTLEQITYKLVATKVHRAWVVDNEKRLLGVVSVTDVMRAFLGLKPMEIENLQYAPPTPPDQRNRSVLIPIS